jgi:bacteriorhodopsin
MRTPSSALPAPPHGLLLGLGMPLPFFAAFFGAGFFAARNFTILFFAGAFFAEARFTFAFFATGFFAFLVLLFAISFPQFSILELRCMRLISS